MSTLKTLTEPRGSSPSIAAEAIQMTTYPAGVRKVAPLHPGAVALDILDDRRISGRKAAEAIGMSPGGLNTILNGDGPVTPETALLFGVYFGNGPEIWLSMQQAYDLWHAQIEMKVRLKKIKPIER